MSHLSWHETQARKAWLRARRWDRFRDVIVWWVWPAIALAIAVMLFLPGCDGQHGDQAAAMMGIQDGTGGTQVCPGPGVAANTGGGCPTSGSSSGTAIKK